MNSFEKKDDLSFIHEAERVAAEALCLRARCGAVIVSEGNIIGRGSNGPAGDAVGDRKCHRIRSDVQNHVHDRTCCVHAEWRAIMDALKTHPEKVHGSTLYFARVDERGAPMYSGEPYCTVCSRLALDAKIAHFVLLHRDGMRSYDTREYNEISYRNIDARK